MENAVDALKIGFALIVFAIAITLTFSVIGQARITADVVFASTDKTSFYDYAENGDYNALENRIVSFETLLPTIHRYAKEQYAVTILDTDGIPIVRYDLYTEGFMGNWDEILKNENKNQESTEISSLAQVRSRIAQVDEFIYNQLKSEIPNISKSTIMESLVKGKKGSYESGTLYQGQNTNNKEGIKAVAPWVGNPDTDTVYRIKADMPDTMGKESKYEKNGVIYQGKHLLKYKNRKFKEMFLEISTSGETVTDRKRFY